MASREDALAEVARVTHVRQLESFAAAVGQAHVLGAPLADTLSRQGIEMRSAHRADVERQIERAPVKLLVPTGTLILPALLLSILGPLLAASGMI
jgi:tight adherence protein C